MNAATQALTMSPAQPQASAKPRASGQTPAPVAAALPLAPRPSRHRPERLALGALVLGAHIGGLLALTYFGKPVTPPEIRPIEIAFIPMEAPPQPEVVPPAPPPPVVRPEPPKKRAEVRPKPLPPKPTPVEPTTSTSETALTAEKSPPAPAQESPPPPAPAPAAPAAPAPAPVVAARFDADYLNNPHPSYPPLSRRMREEGKVMLRVTVNPDGKPGLIEVARSSGFERLDNAAKQAVTRWSFVPARQGDRNIEASVLVPVVFKLEGN